MAKEKRNLPEPRKSDEYNEQNINSIRHHINSCLIILTATDLETVATHRKIKPLPGEKKLIRFYHENITYYLGQFGAYKAVHVQCSMGSMSREGSILTISEVISTIKPAVVVMPGIAFGIDSKQQKIGDVIVAETIFPYNNKRVGKKTTTHRGTPLTASKVLINRFKSIKSSWEFLINDAVKSELIIGSILSGEELIDNKEHRDSLVKIFPNVKGGEMEGSGLYAACDDKVKFVLVKGICDFADGNKGRNKQKKQEVAIEAALSACLEVFTSEKAFETIGLIAIGNHFNNSLKLVKSEQVLFDVYSIEKEPYYIKREIDEKLVKILGHHGMWVFGIPGCGKSNCILRNLMQQKGSFVYISLASCINTPVDAFFSEILFELASRLNPNATVLQPKTYTECNKYIISFLEKNCKNKEVVIFIEEIPLHNEIEEKEFIEKLYSLIANKALVSGLEKVKFVLSSISDPQKQLQPYHQKIFAQIKFIRLENWQNEDITRLISIIEESLVLSLTEETKTKLLTASEGSPRFIKKFFRNVQLDGKYDEESLSDMINETKIELSQI